MKQKKSFNYNEAFMGVFQGRTPGFHKKTYNDKTEMRRIVEMVKVKKGNILDIGCGGGYLTECLPFFYPKARVFGCDISTPAITYAKKFGTGKVSYKTMEKALPYKTDSFDACLCMDVIEHIPDVPYFLREVRRVLKKDGVFLLSIPCEGQPFTFHWFFRKIGIWKDLTFKHVGHIHPEFTHKYVIALFEKHGFQVVAKKYNERWPVQFLRYALFMIPKEILEKVVGKKKAENYYDRNVVAETKKKQDALMGIRKVWFAFSRLLDGIYYLDGEYLTNIPFAAGKIFLLVKNDK